MSSACADCWNTCTFCHVPDHCNGVVLCLTLQAVIFIKLRADFASDKAATGLEVIVPMPKEVQRVSCEYEQDVQPIGNQTWDWQEKQHRVDPKGRPPMLASVSSHSKCVAGLLLCIRSFFQLNQCAQSVGANRSVT